MVRSKEIKPDYVIPSMAEIRNIVPNGLNVVSTFSGCGGTCLGYKMAGYKVLWASEFVGAAREVYALNHPSTILDSRDIRDVKGGDILNAVGMKTGDVDILEGSPPCSSFSTAGKMEESWNRTNHYSDTMQRTDDLFWEFARLVNETQPKVFVAENVSGLIRGVSKGYFKQIYRILKDCGYRVDARLLDASWLGVPQARRRLFIQGVREDLNRSPVFPAPLSFRYNVSDVMPHIRKMKLGGGKHRWSLPGRPFSTICQSDYHIGINASLSTGGWVRTDEGVRRLTIPEVKLLCSFPQDFQLLGSFEVQWERLGRAVPPLMAKAIAQKLRESLFDGSF